jgi:hypothetical protein
VQRSQRISLGRRVAIALSAAALVGGAGARAAAQTVTVQVDVDVAEIAREILSVIDVNVVRDVGRDISRDISSAIRMAVADVPWREWLRDFPWDEVDVRWRAAVGGAAGQSRDFPVEQVDRKTHTLALGPAGSLELRNISGPVSVVAGSGKDVTIEVVRTSHGRTEADAKLGLEQVTAEVDHRGERATINARYPDRRGRPNFSVTVGYTVTAPAGTHITVGGYSTDTTVKGIKGDISIELISGDITISGATRVSAAKTYSGKIWIGDIDGDGNVSAGTISGSVTIERVKGRQVSIDSMSGGIIARDVNVENAVLKTMNGGIEYGGAISKTGRYEMQTHNGPIRLLVSGSGFDLRAQTFAGEIKPAADVELKNVSLTRTSLRGTAGGGGATIVATTFSGSISISRK